jgi:hypothetical protein
MRSSAAQHKLQQLAVEALRPIAAAAAAETAAAAQSSDHNAPIDSSARLIAGSASMTCVGPVGNVRIFAYIYIRDLSNPEVKTVTSCCVSAAAPV